MKQGGLMTHEDPRVACLTAGASRTPGMTFGRPESCAGGQLSGGLRQRSTGGSLNCTRRIYSIREEVRLNSQLWDLA
jgi:hypothetical protein